MNNQWDTRKNMFARLQFFKFLSKFSKKKFLFGNPLSLLLLEHSDGFSGSFLWVCAHSDKFWRFHFNIFLISSTLIFYVILSLETRLLQSINLRRMRIGNMNKIRFGVLEDHCDNFCSCQIFIFIFSPMIKISYSASYWLGLLHFWI